MSVQDQEAALLNAWSFHHDPADYQKTYCPFCPAGRRKETSFRKLLRHIHHSENNGPCKREWLYWVNRFHLLGPSCLPTSTFPPPLPPAAAVVLPGADADEEEDPPAEPFPSDDDVEDPPSLAIHDEEDRLPVADDDDNQVNVNNDSNTFDYLFAQTETDEDLVDPRNDHNDNILHHLRWDDDDQSRVDQVRGTKLVIGALAAATDMSAAMSGMDYLAMDEEEDSIAGGRAEGSVQIPVMEEDTSSDDMPPTPDANANAAATPNGADSVFVSVDNIGALKEKLRHQGDEEGGDKVNFELWDEFQRKKKEDGLFAAWSKEDVHLLLLLKMLNTAKAPLSLFDKITEWARFACLDSAFVPSKGPTRRKKFVERLRVRQGNDVEPVQTKIILPKSKLELNMITFDFGKQLSSLFQDRVLTQWKNLRFFDADNPYAGPPEDTLPFPDDHAFTDLLTGRLATLSFTIMIKMWPGREGLHVPVMITFFMDGTHIDTNGRYTLCPLRFTLSLFKSEVRSKNIRAHRLLAYIPNLDKLKAVFPGSNDKERGANKNFDYQHMLTHALKSYMQCEPKGGVYWEFHRPVPIPGRPPQLVPTPFVFQIYFGMLKGDIQGHNWACAHRQGTGPSTKHPCRRCDTPGDKIHDWDHAFKPTSKQTIKESRKGAEEFSYHWLGKLKERAFDLLRHTGVNKFTSKNRERKVKEYLKEKVYAELLYLRKCDHIGFRTIGDILHGVLKGLLQYMVGEFRLMPRNDLPSTSPKTKILGGGIRRPMAEKALHAWGILLKNQSCRDLPRTNFTAGALSTAKLCANEYPGLTILYLLLVSSTLGDHWFPDFNAKFKKDAYTRMGLLGDDKWKKWALNLDNLCLVVKFLKSDSVTKGEVDMYRRFFPLYMDDYADALDRQTGNGVGLLKTHSGVHIPYDMETYGCTREIDVNVDEGLHIPEGKESASRTQFRRPTFEYQCGKQYSADISVNSAYDELGLTLACYGSQRTGKRTYPCFMGRAFIIQYRHGVCLLRKGRKMRLVYGPNVAADYNDDSDSDDDDDSEELDLRGHNPPPVPLKATWGDKQLQNSIMRLFNKEVFPNCDDHRFLMRNSYHPHSKQIYRAQPGTPTQTGYQGGWNDWAFVNYGGNEVPAHLLCFVDITGVHTEFSYRGTTVGTGDHKFAVCHLVTEREPTPIPGLAEQVSILQRVTKDYRAGIHVAYAKDNLLLYLIPVEAIRGPCICVPDVKPVAKGRDFVGSRDVELDKVEYLMLALPETWKELLVKRMKKRGCDKDPTKEEKAARSKARKAPPRPKKRKKKDKVAEAGDDPTSDYDEDDAAGPQKKKNKKKTTKVTTGNSAPTQKGQQTKTKQNKETLNPPSSDNDSSGNDDMQTPVPMLGNKKATKKPAHKPSPKKRERTDSSSDDDSGSDDDLQFVSTLSNKNKAKKT